MLWLNLRCACVQRPDVSLQAAASELSVGGCSGVGQAGPQLWSPHVPRSPFPLHLILASYHTQISSLHTNDGGCEDQRGKNSMLIGFEACHMAAMAKFSKGKVKDHAKSSTTEHNEIFADEVLWIDQQLPQTGKVRWCLYHSNCSSNHLWTFQFSQQADYCIAKILSSSLGCVQMLGGRFCRRCSAVLRPHCLTSKAWSHPWPITERRLTPLPQRRAAWKTRVRGAYKVPLTAQGACLVDLLRAR